MNIKKFIGNHKTLPILDTIKVENNKAMATDMEKAVIYDVKNIDDGVYLSLDPLVKSEYSLNEHIALPSIKDMNIVEEVVLTGEQIKKLKTYIKNANGRYKNKNFIPVCTGMMFDIKHIFVTDSFSIYIKDNFIGNKIPFIIPKDNMACISELEDIDTTVYICQGHIFFEQTGITTMSLLIQGRIPEIQSDRIIPTLYGDELNRRLNTHELEISKVKGETSIVNNEVKLNINATKLLKGEWKIKGGLLVQYIGDEKKIHKTLE